MQEFKGSPAPWRLGLYGQVKDAEHNIVADVYNTGHAYGRANQAIVLAAPALLEALSTITRGLREGWWGNGLGEFEEGELQLAEDAISAALGQHGDAP